MGTRAQAFWTVGAGRGEIRDESVADPSPDEVMVRALHSGISRGTESLVFHGRVPPTEYQRMRAPLQAGDFPWPVKYGYASVGVVEQGPAELAGRTVFVLHPHQTHYVVSTSMAHLLPPQLPARRAVLAANMETALNGVWDAAVKPGDRVSVVGGGTVGCLVAWLAARVPGCVVELVDVNPAREGTASALGVGFASPDTAQGAADVVIHASGAPAGLDTALALAGDEAVVVEMSWYGNRPVTAALGGAFHARRLTLKSSQVGRVAAANRTRWSTRRRMALAIEMLAEPALDVLLTGETELARLPEAMPRLLAESADVLCHTVRYA
jgi:threonine dehydrogenase-like Zn-dependent dehydrogenase